MVRKAEKNQRVYTLEESRTDQLRGELSIGYESDRRRNRKTDSRRETDRGRGRGRNSRGWTHSNGINRRN